MGKVVFTEKNLYRVSYRVEDKNDTVYIAADTFENAIKTGEADNVGYPFDLVSIELLGKARIFMRSVE